jgi:glycosyltransferase involved in cell wall biosynthesis
MKNYFIPGRGSICGVEDVNLDYKEYKHCESSNFLRVGIVGRICEDKGIPEICEWLNSSNIENVLLKFFGPIDFDSLRTQESFLKFINQNKRKCDLIGNVSDKNQIYNSIDVLLLCSRREGFSNVLIEAQLYNKPVVVRNIYGVKNSYINTKTGFEFTNFDELSEIFNKLNDNEFRRNIGDNARKFVRDNYLRPSVVGCVVNKYEELFNNNFRNDAGC